jgi:hypothetical protein
VARWATTTITLAAPITDAAGKQIKSLDVREQLLRDRIEAERSKTASATMRAAQVIASMAGIPADLALTLKTRDAAKIVAWPRTLEQRDDEFDRDAGKHRFELLVPIATDGADITELTIREPDLAASVAAEKFSNEGEALAAMIAVLGDTTIPIATRLAVRDVERIEAWLLPFMTDPAETA